MNKYHIRIDGIESEGSFTYQELVDMGLFNLPERALKGIEVKRSRNKVFKPFKTYPFPESQSNDESFYVDEYGQIHRKEKKRKKQNLAYVDEYGQIVRPNNSGRSTSSGPLKRIFDRIIFALSITVCRTLVSPYPRIRRSIVFERLYSSKNNLSLSYTFNFLICLRKRSFLKSATSRSPSL